MVVGRSSPLYLVPAATFFGEISALAGRGGMITIPACPIKVHLSKYVFTFRSIESFRPKDGDGEPAAPGRNGERDFHGEKRSNETHALTTDPDARLYRKRPGEPAKLANLGHVLMENRHALVVDTRLPWPPGRQSARRRWRWWLTARAITGSRSEPTRLATWPSLSPICGIARWRVKHGIATI